MDLTYKFHAVSNAEPGAKHDITQFRAMMPHIVQHLSHQDTITCDSGYTGVDKDLKKVNWHIKHKGVRNAPITDEEIEENKKWEDIRRYIEFGFGRVKSKFAVIGTVYRHNRKWLAHIAPFCFAVHNCILRERENPKSFDTEWTGEVPVLPKTEEVYRKVRLPFY